MPATSSHRLRALIVAAAFSTGFVTSATAIELPAEFRDAIEQGIANARYRSVAIALLDREERSEWTFGEVEQGGAKPTSSDAYELGSTTRTFTGLLLAQALVAGKVRIDDTLGKFFPEVHFADPRLKAATLDQLATHRAGLPAVPSNLFPRDVDDPYVGYDMAAMQTYLAHAQLGKDIGSYHYSGFGVALLGEAIARAYHTDFRTLLASEILAPLAMNGTGFGSVPRLVDGERDGKPASHWQLQALAPAVGLRSTLSDLATFAAVQLRPDAHRLRAAILLARQPRASAGGGETSLAWQIIPVASAGQNWPLLWQSGTTGGFASFIGLRTDRQRAVVVLGNASDDLSALGLNLLADRRAPAAPPKRLPMIAPAALAYEGLYRFDTGGDLVVRDGTDGLTAQLGGQLPLPMYAYDEDAFEFGDESAQITFVLEQAKVVGAVLHRGGTNVRAERLSEGAPAIKRNVVALGASELAPYAGDYALSPAVRAHVAVAPPGLRVQLTGTAPIFVQNCASDRFCDADGTLEVGFTRERAKVSALDWRQGVFEAAATRDDW